MDRGGSYDCTRGMAVGTEIADHDVLLSRLATESSICSQASYISRQPKPSRSLLPTRMTLLQACAILSSQPTYHNLTGLSSSTMGVQWTLKGSRTFGRLLAPTNVRTSQRRGFQSVVLVSESSQHMFLQTSKTFRHPR